MSILVIFLYFRKYKSADVGGSDRFPGTSMMRYEYRNQISNLATKPSGKDAFST